jgi:hypothetical protein
MPYDMTFNNVLGRPVQLVVASGNGGCEANAVKYNQQIASGESYLFSTNDNVVCYRRTADPDNPAGGLSGWTSFFPTDIKTPADIDL